MITIKNILIKARKLIENPKNWTKYTMARDANGCRVPCESKSACKFCMSGAIQRVVHDNNIPLQLWHQASDRLKSHVLYNNIQTFNDKYFTKHSNVLSAFDDAINCSKKEDSQYLVIDENGPQARNVI